MNVLTSPPIGQVPCPTIVPPQQIELSGIIQDNFGLHAVFTAGPSQRVVPVDRRDLTSFAAFRDRVFDYLQVRIAFAGAWSDSVAAAFLRGEAT